MMTVAVPALFPGLRGDVNCKLDESLPVMVMHGGLQGRKELKSFGRSQCYNYGRNGGSNNERGGHLRESESGRFGFAEGVVRKEGSDGMIEARSLSQDSNAVSSVRGYDRDGSKADGSRKEASSATSLVVASTEESNDESVELPASVDYISGPGGVYVKHLVRLRVSARIRNATSSVLVVGAVPLTEICVSVKSAGFPIDILFLREDEEVPPGLIGFSRRIVRVSLRAMSKISGHDSPPVVVGVLSFPSTFTDFGKYRGSASSKMQLRSWCSSPRRILVLDSIQDPGNLGTLLRTAAAFAWDGVFLLPGCCDPFNDKALRAARGASFQVPVAVGEWNDVLKFASANRLNLLAGDPRSYDTPEKQDEYNGFISSPRKVGKDGKTRADEQEERGLCLVLGSEGQGLSGEVVRDCSPVGIPMPGKFESLNVAVAGGILMFLLK